MQLFLLQLINSGIPIVISGNECAFDWLKYSQDLSRIALSGTSHFHPIGALDEPDWELEWEALCRGIMQFYVLPLPPTSPTECSITLLECSGGIARLAIILWSEAQRICLYHQRQFVTPDDIKEIYLGYSYRQIKPLADSFRYRNTNLLSSFPDVDVNFYKQHWQTKDSISIHQSILKMRSHPNQGPRKSAVSKQNLKVSKHLKKTSAQNQICSKKPWHRMICVLMA